MSKEVLSKVMKLLFEQVENLVDHIIQSNESVRMTLSEESNHQTEEKSNQETNKQDAIEEEAAKNIKDKDQVEIDRTNSCEEGGYKKPGRRKLELQLPCLKHSKDTLKTEARQCRHMEVMLGNLLVFIRRLCVNKKVREEAGQQSWVQLLLLITSDQTDTHLPQISSVRTRVLTLTLLAAILPHANLDLEAREQVVRQLFIQLSSNMWIIPSAQAHLRASNLVSELQKHLTRLSSPELVDDETRPETPDDNLPVQEVGFDPDRAVCCSVEGGHTLVHGPGGRGYGLGSTPITSGCYQWKFLIVKENRGNEGTCVGVSKLPVKDYSHRTTSDMWLYRAYSGNLYHSGELNVSLPGFTQGDYITVVLDMEAKTLSFGKNGEEPRLAFENIDANELYPCVMFYSTNPGEKVKMVDMQVRGSPRDLDPGDPLCAPQAAVMAEAHISLLRQLHESPTWTQHVNDCIIERLNQTCDLIPGPKENPEPQQHSNSDKVEDELLTRPENDLEKERTGLHLDLNPPYESEINQSNDDSNVLTLDERIEQEELHNNDNNEQNTGKNNKFSNISSSIPLLQGKANLVPEMNLEQLCKEVWPALAVIGGVDSGLRIGGQCWQKGTGLKAMVLGALRQGHPSVKVQWCDGDTNISDVPVLLLEPVEPTQFDVSKMTGLTAHVIIQIMRLAGLTEEIEFPKVIYNRETDEVHSSTSFMVSSSTTGNLVSPHLPQISQSPLTNNSNRMNFNDSKGPSRTSTPRRGSRAGLDSNSLTMDLLTDQLVTNIMDEVTGKNSDRPDQPQQTINGCTQVEALSAEEGIALRLAMLQSASLRTISAIMNCTHYAEMLLVPKANQNKENTNEKGSSASLVREEGEVQAAIRLVIRNLVNVCTLTHPLKRQVSIAEVERAHTVLHNVCMRAWAEDTFSVADAQSRILQLTCNDDRNPCNQVNENSNSERPQSLLFDSNLPSSNNNNLSAYQQSVARALGRAITVPCASTTVGAETRVPHQSSSSSSSSSLSPPRAVAVAPLTPQSAPLPPMSHSHSPSPPLTPLPPPPLVAAPLLEMGFTLRHIHKAISALGHKGEITTSHINQLVTWMLEHPYIHSGEVPSERRRSHDDATTAFSSQLTETREGPDLSGRRRAFLRRSGCVDIRSFMVPSRGSVYLGRGLDQREREASRPYLHVRGEGRHGLNYGNKSVRVSALDDHLRFMAAAAAVDENNMSASSNTSSNETHQWLTLNTRPVREGSADIGNSTESGIFALRERAWKAFVETATTNATASSDNDRGGINMCEVCHHGTSNLRHHLRMAHPGCARPWNAGVCGTLIGGTYILCEVCQEQHAGLGNNLSSNQIGGIGEGQELIRDLSSVLAPDLVPAPLATMEDDGLSLTDHDLKFSNFNSIAPRLGLSERLPVPDPMPFNSSDPLGATTLEGDVADTLDLGLVIPRNREGSNSSNSNVERTLGEQAAVLTSPLARISALRRTTQALRVTVARATVMHALSLLALSGSSCDLWAALQALGLSDVQLLVRLMWLVAHGKVPLDGSARTATAKPQLSEISASLSHLSDAIGAHAQNDPEASRLLLQLCTKHLMVAAMGMSTGDLLGCGALDEDIQDCNNSFNNKDHSSSNSGNNNSNSNKSNSNNSNNNSNNQVQQTSSFPVTQALVSLLAADSSLFQGTSDVLMSPVGTSSEGADPGIQLANALSACILSNKLAHSQRQWAASQLVDCICARAKARENQHDSSSNSHIFPTSSCDFTGCLPRVATALLEGHTSRASSLVWIPSKALLASSGHDGTIRSWILGSRGMASILDNTYVFQKTNELTNYVVTPSNLEHLVALTSGKFLASYVENILNIWPVSGGDLDIWTASSNITTMVTPKIGSHDCLLLGHSDGSITMNAITESNIITSTLMHAGRQDVYVSCLAWYDFKKEAVAGFSDGVIRVFSVQSDNNNNTINAHKGCVTHMQWNCSSSLLASCADDGTKIWSKDCDGNKPLYNLEYCSSPSAIAWSSVVNTPGEHMLDCLLVVGHEDGLINVWKIPQDGKYSLVSEDQQQQFETPKNLRSPQCLIQLKGHQSPVTCLSFSPFGLMLASGALKSMNGLVNIWSMQDGSLLQTLMGTGGVADITWAGKYLAICHTRNQHITIVHMTENQFCKLRVIALCRERLHAWGMYGLHQAPCLKALFSNLPRLLMNQYCYEKPLVGSGEQLVHSRYLQQLCSLALILKLDSVLCTQPVSLHVNNAEPIVEWSWLDTLCTAMRVADSLKNRTDMPLSFIQRHFKYPDKGQVSEALENPQWSLEQDAAVMNWATQSPSDWQVGGRCHVFIWGSGRNGQLAESGK